MKLKREALSHILKDPEFHALPEIERLKVLYEVDPEYRKLHPRERWKATTMIPTPPPVIQNQRSE
jgi:hypothetical protein